ncbi:hypothetical protein [Alicyclobacillus shizuokensis]|uniref:hypothetical protein n=1 Tax=Alicyclobacillus shizuokensis TaxID=392014 RepID=UPI00082BC9B7|nr:hypothetical protein [Alicyclobacillus shizuokensis]
MRSRHPMTGTMSEAVGLGQVVGSIGWGAGDFGQVGPASTDVSAVCAGQSRKANGRPTESQQWKYVEGGSQHAGP